MEEQELKNIWKRSSQMEEIIIDNSKLLEAFKHKMEYRERIVRRRDLRETVAAVIGILWFTYILIELPISISKLGALLMILSMIYVVTRLYNNRKSKFTQNLFLPIKEQLLNQRKFMLHQAHLLGNVHWLFLPVFISYMVFVWGDGGIIIQDKAMVEFLLIRKTLAKIIGTAFMMIYGAYVIRLNKRAVEVNWKPLIEDIDTILKSLKEKD